MASQPQIMLAELPEASATGRIAEIYQEIRRCSGVAYVSSLQRYLATLPGVLEWAWDAIRPAMLSGVIPETGWHLAQSVRLSPARKLPAATLRQWGIARRARPDTTRRHDDALGAIRNVAANFVRVSPVNLVTGACLNRLLTEARPSGPGFPDPWTPPQMLPPMPGNVDPDDLPAEQRSVLLRFATEVDGKPFIPALYRQIAHWPPVLGWLADELAPRFTAAETVTARAAFRAAATNAASDIVSRLPDLPESPLPAEDTRTRVLAAIDRYAETSPEMTMFGQLMLDALPNA